MTALSRPRILSFYPNTCGLAYALFEDDLRPIDWGIKTARREKHATIVSHASRLISLFAPTAILLPVRNVSVRSSRRLQRIGVEIERLSRNAKAPVHWYSRADIQACFAKMGARTKDAIAATIARRLPEFEQHVPPIRRIWMSEDYRMGLFDAVALAVTHVVRPGKSNSNETSITSDRAASDE